MVTDTSLYRNFKQSIIWEGDLNDDCTAKWAGLMLRAEWMDEDYWWWCVYDLLDNEKQIDSSNEYEEKFLGGDVSREKAEKIAKAYLKDKIIDCKINSDKYQDFISDLKVLGASPIETIKILHEKLNIEFSNAKDLVFNSKDWEGIRESSEKFTQEFLNVGAEIADKAEIINGKVISVTFDLTKDIEENKQNRKPISFWNKVKSKFK